VLLLACGASASTATPEGTVSSFTDALRDARFDDAYDMMSKSYRRRVPFAEFERHLRENPTETRDAVAALSRPDGPSEESAVVAFADGDRLELTRESGKWRIATNVVDFYDQSTPRAALRSFVRAMERERYDVVLRMVPDADREGMTVERMREAWSGDGREEIERLLENLRASFDAPIEQVGDRATMPYGDRFTAQLVREDGVWKIEDPD
jgi:hypothetical protein